MNDDAVRRNLITAIESGDRDELATLLAGHGDACLALLNEPTGWAVPMLARSPTAATAQVLIDHGADVALIGQWWAPGFRVITGVDAEVGRFLVDAGAALTPHAAAGLGHQAALEAMIDDDPDTVHAKGGDGCTPLHFARTVAVAELLLDRGAGIDARDDDHWSTPVQWLATDAPDVARFLLDRGAAPDIFIAAAFGDRRLVDRLVDVDPSCLARRVGTDAPDPSTAYEGRGGTIYQWSLGFNAYAHQYALQRGHDELFEHMLERSDRRTRFLVACVTARRDLAESMAREDPDFVRSLPDRDLELLARYCWETNAAIEPVRLMLDLGWPIDFPETRHAYSPLHNAAWGGYADLVDLLLERGAPVNMRDPVFHSTPLGFAIHCCCEEGRHPEGAYTQVIDALIDAGAEWDPTIYPTGEPKIDDALRPRLRDHIIGAVVDEDEARLARCLERERDDTALAQGLSVAARCGSASTCRRLLDAGASLGSIGEGGLTPLHKSVSTGRHGVATLLLERGADACATSTSASTPLHTAGVVGADPAMIDLLVRHGAGRCVNAVNRFDATPLSLAIEKGHDATAAALRAHGADAAG